MEETTLVAIAGAAASVTWAFTSLLWKALIRYVPNKPEQVAMWRDLGMADEEIKLRFGWSRLSSQVAPVDAEKAVSGQRCSESGFHPSPALQVDSAIVSEVPRLTGP